MSAGEERARLCILAGVRTPFAKSGGVFADYHAEDLGTFAVRELLLRTGADPARLDAVVVGNVGQQARAANIARVIALRSGIPERVPAMTVHRNCASGFEAVTQCADLLALGRGRLFVACGTESMSDYPLTFNAKSRAFFQALAKAKRPAQRLAAMARVRPSMFKPEIALLQGLTDPVAGLGMGETAELLAREWSIGRGEQDAFATDSHKKALAGRERLREETFDVVTRDGVLRDDDGVREDSSVEKLAKLRPVFARAQGTVTAGNSSQITDGAVALLVGHEDEARALGVEPLGYVTGFAYAGCDPARMGLGPVYAIDRLYPGRPVPWGDFDLFEINEAFAAQVIACLRAFRDPAFCRDKLGRDPMGELPADKLNVNGGAIALGHPVGASGARLVLTALLELRRRHGREALVSLCVGGGQGGAISLRAAT